MKVIDFEAYATERGCSRLDIGEPALHKRQSSYTQAQWDRMIKAQSVRDSELVAKREELWFEYQMEVEAGNIRPPTTEEQCAELVTGQPDNPEVLAAKKCLEILAEDA